MNNISLLDVFTAQSYLKSTGIEFILLIRNAQKKDAHDLAILINKAGEGIPMFVWESIAEPGESALEVGVRRASREEGCFSYHHARVCEFAGEIAGMILAYRLPDPYVIENLSEYPAFIQPLLELELLAPGVWYINALATYKPFRGKGIASRLIEDSAELAREKQCEKMGLIVASENQAAKSLYEYLGFQSIASKTVIPYPGSGQHGDWLFMIKALT